MPEKTRAEMLLDAADAAESAGVQEAADALTGYAQEPCENETTVYWVVDENGKWTGEVIISPDPMKDA